MEASGAVKIAYSSVGILYIFPVWRFFIPFFVNNLQSMFFVPGLCLVYILFREQFFPISLIGKLVVGLF